MKKTYIGQYCVEDSSRPYDGGDLSFNELCGYEIRSVYAILTQPEVYDSYSSIDGCILQYARRALGLTRGDLANILQVSADEIIEYESNQRAVYFKEFLVLIGLLSKEIDKNKNIFVRKLKDNESW